MSKNDGLKYASNIFLPLMLVVIFIVVSCNMVSDVKLIYAVADMLSRSQLDNPPSIGRHFVKSLDVNNRATCVLERWYKNFLVVVRSVDDVHYKLTDFFLMGKSYVSLVSLLKVEYISQFCCVNKVCVNSETHVSKAS